MDKFSTLAGRGQIQGKRSPGNYRFPGGANGSHYPPIVSIVNFNTLTVLRLTLPSRQYRVDVTYGSDQAFPGVANALCTVTIFKHCTGTSTTRHIHPGYARLLSSLNADIEHAEHNRDGDVRLRMKYARLILDQFSLEIIQSNIPESLSWRSSVLNPLLQRQLHGYSDGNGHMLSLHFQGEQGERLDHLVDEFYFKVDPLDPQAQPALRQNILYITEARWFLGRNGGDEWGVDNYAACRRRTAQLFERLCQHSTEPQDFELDIIVEERLEAYFWDDYKNAVGLLYTSPDKVCTY